VGPLESQHEMDFTLSLNGQTIPNVGKVVMSWMKHDLHGWKQLMNCFRTVALRELSCYQKGKVFWQQKLTDRKLGATKPQQKMGRNLLVLGLSATLVAGDDLCVAPGTCVPPTATYSRVPRGPVPSQQWW